MSFQVPYDSSPPSTPEKSGSLFSNVSTTPAGAPPSKANSFTPLGPPPSTAFGSSQLDSRPTFDSPGSLFTKSGNMNMNPNDSLFGSSFGPSHTSHAASRTKNGVTAKSFATSQSFSMTNGTRFGESANFAPSDSFTSSKMSEDVWQDVADEEASEQETDGDMDMETTNGQSSNRVSFLDSHIGDSLPPRPITALGHRKSPYSSPASVKRPKLDERANQSPLRRVRLSPKKGSPMGPIVRNFASRSRPAAVKEPGEMITQSEDELCRMYDEFGQAQYKDIDLNLTLSEISENLTAIWGASIGPAAASRPFGTDATIGPGEHAPNVVKAAFLGSLLLQLHHPPAKSEHFSSSTGQTAPQSLILSGRRAYSPVAMPKFLLGWLDSNHMPQSLDFHGLNQLEPNPTASPNFWEIIKTGVLRGRFSEVTDILRSADFNYARSALEDGLAQAGYRGRQLQNIQRCVNKLLQILESCPGFQHDNWDVRGADWSLYRKRVISAVNDLDEFAEAEEQPTDNTPASGTRFQAINFGLGAPSGPQNLSFTQSARMAESHVPWAIYQNLKSIYRIILGDVVTISTHAQDWVEATIAMTVWWDGEDDDDASGPGFSTSTANFKRSHIPKQALRSVDDDPREAYLQRLGLAYNSATSEAPDDAGFRVNSLNGLEVALASVFEGDIEGVLELLQTWSLCVTSAVAEVSYAGGWFGSSDANTLPGLNEDDLMVLSYGQNENPRTSRVHKDDILSAYASGLFERPSIENELGARGGWEVGLGILSRLDDTDRMQKSVSEMLDRLPLDTPAQMDKVVLLCGELGLEEEGRRVAERYGDVIVSKSEDYGLVLVCYARGHNRRKVKSVVDLLASYSIVQSRAYPSFTDLDADLRILITDPKAYLSGLAEVDEEAASILQFYFSGYATLRRFYEIRDEAIGLKDGQRPHFKPLARRRAAAQALVAVIGSAADSIYGGLYDPDRDSAVQVDGLLALLGEALAFIDQPTPILSLSDQFTILSAIEDLETVTPRVYSQCEECFRSTLLEYHSSRGGDQSTSESFALPPSPRALLKKSMSSLTASSTFSFIGSDMLESARARSISRGGSGSSSAVLVPRSDDQKESYQRGWDWRAGLSEDAKGEDVLRMLRLGLARGVSYGALGSI